MERTAEQRKLNRIKLLAYETNDCKKGETLTCVYSWETEIEYRNETRQFETNKRNWFFFSSFILYPTLGWLVKFQCSVDVLESKTKYTVNKRHWLAKSSLSMAKHTKKKSTHSRWMPKWNHKWNGAHCNYRLVLCLDDGNKWRQKSK